MHICQYKYSVWNKRILHKLRCNNFVKQYKQHDGLPATVLLIGLWYENNKPPSVKQESQVYRKFSPYLADYYWKWEDLVCNYLRCMIVMHVALTPQLLTSDCHYSSIKENGGIVKQQQKFYQKWHAYILKYLFTIHFIIYICTYICLCD